jgi:hypothetical protein
MTKVDMTDSFKVRSNLGHWQRTWADVFREYAGVEIASIVVVDTTVATAALASPMARQIAVCCFTGAEST